jgi:hypothetical protein
MESDGLTPSNKHQQIANRIPHTTSIIQIWRGTLCLSFPPILSWKHFSSVIHLVAQCRVADLSEIQSLHLLGGVIVLLPPYKSENRNQCCNFSRASGMMSWRAVPEDGELGIRRRRTGGVAGRSASDVLFRSNSRFSSRCFFFEQGSLHS